MDTNILRKDYPESSAPTEATPHGCYEGWVYLGFEDEDEQGEHVELVERVACRRCLAAGPEAMRKRLERALRWAQRMVEDYEELLAEDLEAPTLSEHRLMDRIAALD